MGQCHSTWDMICTCYMEFNTSVPGRYVSNIKGIIFKHITQNSSFNTGCEIALRSMPKILTNEKSTLVQAITSTGNEQDLRCHVVSLGCNELTDAWSSINILRPRQNGRYFPDDIFKCIFLNENIWILIMISLKFVPEGPINNIPALVQIMAWHRSGDEPLSEPMMVLFTDAYMRHLASMS